MSEKKHIVFRTGYELGIRREINSIQIWPVTHPISSDNSLHISIVSFPQP